MRPVDLQPAILQTPNVERTGQQQVANPQTAQAAFAAELQRRASERPAQVQPPEAQEGAQPARVKPEERGEQRARRRPRRRAVGTARSASITAGAASAEPPAPAEPGAPGSKLDVVI